MELADIVNYAQKIVQGLAVYTSGFIQKKVHLKQCQISWYLVQSLKMVQVDMLHIRLLAIGIS